MRDLADLVHVAACTAAAAQRRVDGRPRDAAQVIADLGPVQARLDYLCAAAHATASHNRAVIAAGLERVRRAAVRCDELALRDASREEAEIARLIGYGLKATVSEARALRLLRDQLAAELAEARRHPTLARRTPEPSTGRHGTPTALPGAIREGAGGEADC